MPTPDGCVFVRSGKPGCEGTCQSPLCINYMEVVPPFMLRCPAGHRYMTADPNAVCPLCLPPITPPPPAAEPMFNRVCDHGHSYQSAHGDEPCPECAALEAQPA